MIFSERTAVITGAAGRIGRALAQELGQSGVSLALVDINPDALRKAAEVLQPLNVTVRTYVMDVTNAECVEQVSQEILHDFGKVDILVNNAGRWPGKAFLDMDEDFWQQVIDINLNSVFRLTKAFAPGMAERHYGRIVNLGSIAGESGLPGYTAYSVSKAGVIMLTKDLAMEFAKKGITVNCVSPGMISDVSSPNNGTWLGRCGTGEDVARLIAFLCSDDTGYITGVDYTIDGGRILGPHNASF